MRQEAAIYRRRREEMANLGGVCSSVPLMQGSPHPAGNELNLKGFE